MKHREIMFYGKTGSQWTMRDLLNMSEIRTETVFLKLFVIMLVHVQLLWIGGAQGREDDPLASLPSGNTPAARDPVMDEALRQGLASNYRDEYEKSISVFEALVDDYPEHPAPYFYLAATYQNWMSSYRVNRFADELDYYVNLAVEKGKAALAEKDNSWLYFYMGSSYGFRAYYRFRKHNWIGAYFDLVKGNSNLKKAVELDSTLYDVYLALGTYYYWRTAKSKVISTVAFWIPDKRDLGLQQIEFSMYNGRYCQSQAAYVLLVSLIDTQDYQGAERVLQHILSTQTAPTVGDLYYAGYIHAKLERWHLVEEMFTKQIAQLESYPEAFGYQIECKYWIARSLYERNLYDQAGIVAAEAIELDQHHDEDKELEGPILGYEEIKQKLDALVNALDARLEHQKGGTK